MNDIVAIQGSRSLKGDDVRKLIINRISELEPRKVVTSGEISGVCEIARDVCSEVGMPLELHFYNVDKYARGAFHRRSVEVQKASDYVVFIHDGISKGTSNEIAIARKTGKPYEYHEIKLDKARGIEVESSSDFLWEG